MKTKFEINDLPQYVSERYASDQEYNGKIDLPLSHPSIASSISGGISTYSSYMEKIPTLNTEKTSHDVAFCSPNSKLVSPSYCFSSAYFHSLKTDLKKLKGLQIPEQLSKLIDLSSKLETMIVLVESLKTVKKM